MSDDQPINPLTSVKRQDRAARSDGEATKRLLIEKGGEEFAARGYAGATSKAICESAGVPMASVNYHFGSRDGLYEAVLLEAHNQLFKLSELEESVAGLEEPEERLRAAITFLVGIASRPDTPWGYRVVLRELLAPSAALNVLVDKGIKPKAAIMQGLVAQYMKLTPADPAVQRGLMFTILPCIALMVAPRDMPSRVLPSAFSGNVASDFVAHTMAGLRAIAAIHRP